MNAEKWYNKRIFCIPIWVVGLAIFVATVGYAAQQTLQLTTYYPAPYGEYTQMRVAEKLEMLPTSKLQATKGAGISRVGMEVDLTKSDPIQLSSFSDINNTNYSIDPNGTSIFKQLRTEEITGKVKFGGVEFVGWPILLKAGKNDSGTSYHLLNPSNNAAVESSQASAIYSTKFYCGTSKAATVVLPNPGFASPDYFVMVSPRQLYSPVSLSGRTSHNTGHRHHNLERLTTNFNYYKIAKIDKTKSSFTATFEGTIPTEFDWIAIGY